MLKCNKCNYKIKPNGIEILHVKIIGDYSIYLCKECFKDFPEKYDNLHKKIEEMEKDIYFLIKGWLENGE